VVESRCFAVDRASVLSFPAPGVQYLITHPPE
jgi:hypothetical protein